MPVYKTNPWLVSTVLLLGLILGYALAVAASGLGFDLPGTIPAGPTLKLPAAEAFADLPQSRTPEGYPVLGNPQAKITLTEYSDFQCPFCERFATEAYSQIVQTYLKTGQAKLVFRNFPLPFHKNAQAAAEAALCAGDQNQFWPYHDALFLNQKLWENDPAPAAIFGQMAKKLKLDKSDFAACLASQKYAQHVQKDLADGVAAGVEGTPTVFVGTKAVVGAQPFAAFQAAVEAALSPASSPEKTEAADKPATDTLPAATPPAEGSPAVTAPEPQN